MWPSLDGGWTMKADAESEIKPMLANISRLLEKVIADQEKIIATQEKHTEQISEIRGDIKAVNARLDEQRAWLQSMDQRFTAMMAPYYQKPAA
jgi:nicotinamidase-related amidase